MTSSETGGTAWRALRHRNFALFFTGQGLSLCGTWMQSLAQAWLVYRLTGSPFLLGLVEFAGRAPILAFSLVGGLLADRWPRHRVMLATQVLSLVQAATLAALTLSGHITIEWILALATLLGIINAVDVPVRQSFVGDLVPRADIPSAIGLNASAFNGARVIGPSVAGLLVVTVGEGLCFLLNALSYLIVIGCLAAMRVRKTARTAPAGAIRFLAEGLRYAWHTPHVRALLALITVLSLAAVPYSTLLPVFAGEILKTGANGLGLLMASTGVGALAGAFQIARRGTVRGLGSYIAGAVVLYGAGLLALAYSTTLWISLPALVAVGFGMITSLAGTNTLLQSLAPDDLRGRVMSLYAMVALGFATFGSLLAGAGATYLGAPLTVAAGGLITLASAAFFWSALPAIRRHVRENRLLPPDELAAP
ncbi:MAG: MFS transporter [Nitrospirae bacterium]|nr:MAG: MFS transporter [Nitrospirota bacterium]